MTEDVFKPTQDEPAPVSPWRRQSRSTSIYVGADLDQFTPKQLLQGLIDCGWIDANEAAQIAASGEDQDRQPRRFPRAPVQSDIEAVEIAAARGNLGEAIIHVERMLGNGFVGRLTSLLPH